MKLIFISDTHAQHRAIKIPDGDILLHCGDITWKGELPIMEDFSNWIKELSHRYKCVIFGNHELGLENGIKRKPAIDMITDAGGIYLEDSSVDIEGIKIHGSPVQPWFHDWAWNRQRGKDISAHWDKIPDDTNVLLTHGPPYGILDRAPRGFDDYENVGCEDLLKRIQQLKNLKIHAFGHIHNSYGIEEKYGIKFVNASSCTERYKPTNKPIVIEI